MLCTQTHTPVHRCLSEAHKCRLGKGAGRSGSSRCVCMPTDRSTVRQHGCAPQASGAARQGQPIHPGMHPGRAASSPLMMTLALERFIHMGSALAPDACLLILVALVHTLRFHCDLSAQHLQLPTCHSLKPCAEKPCIAGRAGPRGAAQRAGGRGRAQRGGQGAGARGGHARAAPGRPRYSGRAQACC